MVVSSIVYFHSILGEMMQFEYFTNGLKTTNSIFFLTKALTKSLAASDFFSHQFML